MECATSDDSFSLLACLYCYHFRTDTCRQSIFLVLTVAAVVTNAGLAVFTMQNLDHLSTTARYWCFIGFQWVCFALQVTRSMWVILRCGIVTSGNEFSYSDFTHCDINPLHFILLLSHAPCVCTVLFAGIHYGGDT